VAAGYQPPGQAAATLQAPVADDRQQEVEHLLQHLANPDERVRADSALQLGRMRVQRAVDPLAATLAGDRSPAVREAAARALGLIASPKALPALQRAAQADADRDVRHSARFAVDVLQSGLGR
jgi:HEAT repeat protein